MANDLIYMPVFRLRTEEKKVLHSRQFGKHTYPCVEIIKGSPQKEREPQKNTLGKNLEDKQKKSFAEIHLPILEKINSNKVFVDLPVHFIETARVNGEVLKFLRSIVNIREKRTEAILSLRSLSKKIIPVISTFFNKTNEKNSIILQEKDLRTAYSVLAFRTFPENFDRDFPQIEKVLKQSDYIIFDINDKEIDLDDPDLIQSRLNEIKKKIKCQIIILKNNIPISIKNNSLVNGKAIPNINCDHLLEYKNLFGTAFGDYVGIKKDPVSKGGGISPGFIFFDPVKRVFYGYRGDIYEVNGKKTGDLGDFEAIIVPQVINSPCVKRLISSGLPYLDNRNKGWELINLIYKGIEPGKSQGKFKRISMEHYLHCIETGIDVEIFS